MNAKTTTAPRRALAWTLTAAAGAVTAIALSAGLAVADDNAPDDREDRRAALEVCKAEFEAVCGDVEPGEGRVKACLAEHTDELSPQCAQLAERKADGKKGKKKGKRRGLKKKVLEACGEDIRAACGEPDEDREKGELRACIQEHRAGFSQTCQDTLAEIEAKRDEKKAKKTKKAR